MAIELPQLPFEKNALEPYMSEGTLDLHYGKHHNAYVTKLNQLIADTDLENSSLEDIIRASYGQADKVGIFNNAAQIWNHTFFWNGMKKDVGDIPPSIASKLEQDFGGVDKFKKKFIDAGIGQFGSGWVWLVRRDADGSLAISSTGNAGTPLTDEGMTPVLVCDVWEHAYYVDYQNRRPDFLQVFVDHLINWDFVAKNLEA